MNMNTLPHELLEAILDHLAPRDLAQARAVSKSWSLAASQVQTLTVLANVSVHSLPRILKQFPRLNTLRIQLAQTAHSGSSFNVLTKATLVDSLHRVAGQFTGHAKLKHLVTDSELSLAGALKCPNLLSLRTSTVFTFDALLDAGANGGDTLAAAAGGGQTPAPLPGVGEVSMATSVGSSAPLMNHARNLANIFARLPQLESLHMVRPIFWRRPEPDSKRRTSLDMLSPHFGIPSTPASLTRQQAQLRNLSLEYIPAWSLVNLITYIGQAHLPHLQRFALQVDLHLPHAFVDALAAGCPRIESLELGHCRLAPTHLDDLEQLASSLRILRLNSVEAHVPQLARGRSIYEWILPFIGHILPSLTHLDLIHVDFAVSPLPPLPDHLLLLDLQQSPCSVSLTHLTVFDLSDENECSPQIAATLFPNLQLLKLHLGYAGCDQHYLSLSQLKQLQTLELRYREPPRSSAAGASSALACFDQGQQQDLGILPLASGISSLKFWVPPPSSTLIRAALIPMRNALRTLIINYPSAAFADAVVGLDLPGFPVLQNLEIRAISSHSAATVQRLARAFAANPLPKLRRLHLETVYHLPATMDMETVIELSRAAPHIRVFELQGFRISSDLLTTIARAWNQHVRVVELCGNAIAEMDMELMAAVDRLVAACSSLTGLTLSVDEIADNAYERAVMVEVTGRDSTLPPTSPVMSPVTPARRNLAMLSETAHDSAIDLSSGSSSSGGNTTSPSGSSEEEDEDAVPELLAEAAETVSRPVAPTAVLWPRTRVVSATGLGFLRQERESAVRRAAVARWLLLKYRRLEDVVVAAKTPCRGIGNTASGGDGV